MYKLPRPRYFILSGSLHLHSCVSVLSCVVFIYMLFSTLLTIIYCIGVKFVVCLM